MLMNQAVDRVDHEHGPNRKLHDIAIDHPISIANRSAAYPDRELHRNIVDDNPARQRVPNRVALLRLSRRKAPVVLLSQPRRALAVAVLRHEVGASGLALS